MTDNPQEQELPLLEKPRLKTYLVDSDESLAVMLAEISKAERIAIDAERASGFRYGQKAYLIQIAVEDVAIFLFDPTIKFDEIMLSHLIEQVNSKTWIIHAASQDLPCLEEIGFRPSRLLDTELAGRLLGYPKVSLGVLCEKHLTIRLAKEHSAVDWSVRPLPEDWLTYAALDVDVLFDLWREIEKELRAQDKYQIAIEEFDYLTRQAPKEEKPDRWRSTTGIQDIKQARGLTIVKSMWQAREELAKEKDVAPGRLLPDLSIVAAVKAEPKSKSELASLRAFTGRASRTYLDLWWKAYETGLQTHDVVELRLPNTGIPNHRNWPSKFPEANIRLQWMKILLKDLSDREQIPVENLVSPDLVRRLCFNPPVNTLEGIEAALQNGGARGWQIRLATSIFTEGLQKTELPVEAEAETPKA